MVPQRRMTIEVAVVASACALAGTAFLTGRSPQPPALQQRSEAASSSALEFRQFRSAASAEAAPAAAWTWTSVVAMAVACGLVVGVVQPPARADDVGEYRASDTKSIRARTKRQDKLKEENKAEEKVVTKKVVETITPTKRTFVNPSDELDEDEIPFEDWSAEHPVQLILTGLIPTFIYLTFYILGSLEII
eukprot:TRINITY_DN2780_c0_g1_i1.p1 TRINITY_DN2780_c0_g1~~TRINITY_DN2780_c0_g1_i1.p1  ORF type:complete len:191 (-),score=56.48 TRINITY_DN2780_c0_g1_i1:190-762(-)